MSLVAVHFRFHYIYKGQGLKCIVYITAHSHQERTIVVGGRLACVAHLVFNRNCASIINAHSIKHNSG